MATYRLEVDARNVPDFPLPVKPCEHCGVVDPKKVPEMTSPRAKLYETMTRHGLTVYGLTTRKDGFNVNWPDHPYDMAELSQKFPFAIFTLHVDKGCIKYYAEGKEQVELCPAFPPFNRASLKPVPKREVAERVVEPLVRKCDTGEEGCTHPLGDNQDWCRIHYRHSLLKLGRETGSTFSAPKKKCTCKTHRKVFCPMHGGCDY